MGFEVYDCRRDIRNILVRPQIRARFCRLEPGTGSLDAWHTHDLGDEIFIILSGRVEFKINGEVKEVGPGQMCYALTDEPHSVRVIGDEPVYMYLSVTPHIQPTHTFYDDKGERQRPHFRPSSDYDTDDGFDHDGGRVDRRPHRCSARPSGPSTGERAHPRRAGTRTQAGPNGWRHGSGQPRARGHVGTAFAAL